MLALLVSFKWDITAGSVLIALTILGAVYGLWKMGPVGAETVGSLERLLNATKLERTEIQAQRDEAIEESTRLLGVVSQLRVDLARCEERPSTLELAQEMLSMQESFKAHRDDLMHTQNQVLGHLEAVVGASRNVEQAVTLLVEQLRSRDNPTTSDQ